MLGLKCLDFLSVIPDRLGSLGLDIKLLGPPKACVRLLSRVSWFLAMVLAIVASIRK
jgi:hypothetical protein